jgi:hypothetical protein
MQRLHFLALVIAAALAVVDAFSGVRFFGQRDMQSIHAVFWPDSDGKQRKGGGQVSCGRANQAGICKLNGD